MANAIAGQYGVAIDPNIPKGGVKIRTKVGDIDISVDSWMDGLEKQINEQFAVTQNN
jgi:flagellar biosynthesis/type III secretory pathway protein FliH